VNTPKIFPASYPDTLEDVADGATFYPDAAPYHGQAFIATRDWTAAKDARLVVHLGTGDAFHFPREWSVRVTALSAVTVDDRW